MPVFDLAELKKRLPWRLHYVSTTRSTNDLAARMRREKRLFAPAVVLTPRQTRGRGRGGNTWTSDPGTLTVTFVLSPDEAHQPHHLSLVAGLAVRDAAQSLLGSLEEVSLKWPNDVYVGNRKLAGLLCERVENVDIIGVGLNVRTSLGRLPAAVRGRATSLEVLGSNASVTEALVAVAKHLAAATEDRQPITALLKRYDAHHLLVGRKVQVRTGAGEDDVVSGTCKGLDAMGRLLVANPAAVHRVIAGQVENWS